MFNNVIKKESVKKIVNGNVVEDYIKISLFSPNGNNFLYDFIIPSQDISILIKVLQDTNPKE